MALSYKDEQIMFQQGSTAYLSLVGPWAYPFVSSFR